MNGGGGGGGGCAYHAYWMAGTGVGELHVGHQEILKMKGLA